jgi:peptidoglycan/xylan/chitin deacetylase (PgdA/CDA1 family)
VRRLLESDTYTVLVYHRFAGELKPGQERIDISPRRFARQMRALRLAGFRPLSADEIVAFHSGRDSIPARSVAITVDDAIEDCVEPLRRQVRWRPQLFVPTAELGRTAHWIDGEDVATWDQVLALAEAGVSIGSHTRHHRRLSTVEGDAREDELVGSFRELRDRLPGFSAVLAYPNGDHDDTVCADARAAGYAVAFTTEKGRNDFTTDPFRLHRVSVHGADGMAAAVWKAATGHALPGWWLRLRALLGRTGT